MAHSPTAIDTRMVGMDENPYKAPSHDHSATDRKKVGCGRCLALIGIFPCLLIVVYCLFAIAVGVIAMAVDSRIGFPWKYLVWWTMYAVNAATWTATAWAIWANRRRAVIAALLADAVALVLGYIGW